MSFWQMETSADPPWQTAFEQSTKYAEYSVNVTFQDGCGTTFLEGFSQLDEGFPKNDAFSLLIGESNLNEPMKNTLPSRCLSRIVLQTYSMQC